MGSVFVVFCIDAEGYYIDPHYYNPNQLLGSWPKIEEKFLSKVFSPHFRHSFPDSSGNNILFTWFILNWTGYRTWPVKHDFGYHKIFDYYKKNWSKKMTKYNDELAWHYHHIPLSGVGNEWGTNFIANRNFEEILPRILIDRNFFPTSVRTGGTIENNDLSHWLEEWIPIDFSNRNGKDAKWNYKEADGRTVDTLTRWKKAPSNWIPYHPSWSDYAKKGTMKRFIAKSVDLKSSFHSLEEQEIVEAFKQAKDGDIVLSIFDHDFRDRVSDISRALGWILKASKKFKTQFQYISATEAIKKANNMKNNKFTLSITSEKTRIVINANCEIFSNQPYFAIKYSSNIYKWRPLFKTGLNTWEYPLVKEDHSKKAGIAAHDRNLNKYVKTFIIV